MNDEIPDSSYQAALKDVMAMVNNVIADHRLLYEYLRHRGGDPGFVGDMTKGGFDAASQIGRLVSIMIDEAKG